MTSTFKRPHFSPTPQKELEERNGHHAIASLPDLIRYNAKENPDHIFCTQAEVGSGKTTDKTGTSTSQYDSRQITFGQLGRAVDSCARWIHKTFEPSRLRSSANKPRPIALYLESDIGLFIHLAALLAMDIPVRSKATIQSSNTSKHQAYFEIDPSRFSQTELAKRVAPA